MTDAVADAIRPVASRPAPSVRVRGYWGNVWQRLRYDYVTLFCLTLIVVIVLLAVFAPLVAPMDPYKSSMAHRLRPIAEPGSPSRHRRTGPRHAEPHDLRRPGVADHGHTCRSCLRPSSADCSASSPAI